MRGTLANVRLRNQLAPGTEGGVTLKLPEGTEMSIFDAAMAYGAEGTPLIVLGGKEYGSGSSRDWAAKGVKLLGVRAVLAESFERIHRSNLVGMGVLPLQYMPGESAVTYGLDGTETFDIEGLDALNRGETVAARARHRHRRRRRGRALRACACASTRPPRPSTTATAACSTSCCANWPASRTCPARGSPRRPPSRRSVRGAAPCCAKWLISCWHRLVGAGDRHAHVVAC